MASATTDPQRSYSRRDLRRHPNPQVHIDCSENADERAQGSQSYSDATCDSNSSADAMNVVSGHGGRSCFWVQVRCTTATSSSHSAMTSSFGSALAITRHGRPCRACPGATSRRSSAHQQQRPWALHLDACKSATSLGERTRRRTRASHECCMGRAVGLLGNLERRERGPGPQPPCAGRPRHTV